MASPKLSNTEYKFKVIKDMVVNLGPKHNVHVFGGFVRDHIIPEYNGDSFEFTKLAGDDYLFHDIDMWAKSEQDARALIEDFTRKYSYTVQEPDTNVEGYMFNVWTLVPKKPCYPIIQIVVSPHYPVNDSPLNLASYDGTKVSLHPYGNSRYTMFTDPPYTIPEIRRLVLEHSYPVFESYYKDLVMDSTKPVYQMRMERLRRRGWTVCSH